MSQSMNTAAQASKKLIEGKKYKFIAMGGQVSKYVGCWDECYWFEGNPGDPLSWLSIKDSLEDVVEV